MQKLKRRETTFFCRREVLEWAVRQRMPVSMRACRYGVVRHIPQINFQASLRRQPIRPTRHRWDETYLQKIMAPHTQKAAADAKQCEQEGLSVPFAERSSAMALRSRLPP